jgi:hypothetical protein
MKDWQHFRRKELGDFFVEMTLASWGIGFYISPTGPKHLYDLMLGPFCIGYEYKTRAYRRAVKRKEP